MAARRTATKGSEGAASRLAAIIGQGAQGAALARALAREGARTRADLRRPEVLARLPRASRASVVFNPVRRAPLAEAQAVCAEVQRRLVFAFPGGAGRPEVLPVGSVRRLEPRADDLDFLVVYPAGGPVARGRDASEALALWPPRAGDRVSFGDTYSAGARRRSAILCVAPAAPGKRARNFRADFFLCSEAERPFALFHFTGSRQYNIRIRAFAKKKGWLLNQYGLFVVATGRRVRGSSAIRTERDLAAFLGVTYRLPTDRAR